MRHTHPTHRTRAWIALAIMAMLIGVWIPTLAEGTTTPVPRPQNAITVPSPVDPPVSDDDGDIDPPLIIIIDEEVTEPIDEPTDEPAVDASEEVISTPESAPVETQPTPEPTNEDQSVIEFDPAPVASGNNNLVDPNAAQTFCQMSIDDGGDNDPFTYGFSAINSANIDTFAWNFGDTNTANGAIASHTYTTTGTFAVQLTCNPLAGFGAPIVLNGSITVASPPPLADFVITPSTVFDTQPPHTLAMLNASNGGGLTFDWKISDSSDPLAAGFYTATTENINFTFTEALLNTYGYPNSTVTFYIHLLVTDGAGQQNGIWRSVVFGPPAPLATFTLTPSSGPAPLTVTVEGVDLNEGPITSWEWDFGDGSPVVTGQGPHVYEYTVAGVYTIELNYTGPGGGGTHSKQVGVAPSGAPVQSQFNYYLTGRDTGGAGIEVCFVNESTGPFVTSEWDFDGDGTYDLTDNSAEVCHIYPSSGDFNVRLRVIASDVMVSSTSSRLVIVTAAPVAAFSVVPGTIITEGTLVNLVDASTGVINDWEWDFDGDGVIDSTTQNPVNINLASYGATALGAKPIRLTVRGPGGVSFVELVVFVQRLELTCDFTGALTVLPGSAPQTYTANLGNVGGRTVTYAWTVTGIGAGLPITGSGSSINIDWASIGFGAFQVTLQASTPDGSLCNVTKTVNRSWQGLDCQTANNLPALLYADGQNYTFTANVANLDGRPATYRWFVNGALQGETGAVFTWTNTIDTGLLPWNVTVRYEVDVDNGVGYIPDTATCFDDTIFTVLEWPTLVCASIGGQGTPIPATPDNGTRSYNYTANITGVAGRTVSYLWTVSDGTITTPNPRVNNNMATVRWNTTAGSLDPAPQDDNISVIVTVTNPDGSTVDCNMNRNIRVEIPRLDCAIPIGDQDVVFGETEGYLWDIYNVYGRPYTSFQWEVYEVSPIARSFPQASGTTPATLNLTFPLSVIGFDPDNPPVYEIRYTATVDAVGAMPGDTCSGTWSPRLPISMYAGVGVNFQCEAANVTGTFNPNNAAATYVYQIDMDNGNNFLLRYTWILTDSSGDEYVLAIVETDEPDIVNSSAFTLAQLAPLGIDSYNLRVEVEAVDPADSTHTCARDIDIVAGSLDVIYTYAAGSWTNTAIPVGQAVCLTNTSNTVPGGIGDLAYLWTVIGGSPADYSWVSNTFVGQDPDSCITFSTPGSYTINLYGENASGLHSDDYQLTFNVYGLQSILIGRTGSSFANTLQSFTAVGTNITGAYNWVFTRLSDNVTVATRTGVQNPANVGGFTTPGAYRATVTGTGPLGVTTASLEFTLLAPNALSASFIPSVYGGTAPMTVCFTDTSISGTPILNWEWDLDGNGSYETTGQGSPHCMTYNDPGQVYTIRLRVTNSALIDTAQNVIRTYNLLERSATFSIAPQPEAGRFCFTPDVSGDVIVTSWVFGDGTSVPAVGANGLGTVCHTYGASGQYLVEMNITNSGGTSTGTVVRPVVVNLTSPAPAVLVASGVCAADTTATFTVTNTGGNMLTPDQVRVRDADGNVILIAPLQLATGGSANFVVSGYVGAVTLSTTDLVVTANTDCQNPPQLSIDHVCAANGAVTFTVTSGVTSQQTANQPYEIRDAANVLVTSGTLNIAPGGSQTVTVNPAASYGVLTFTSNNPTQGISTNITDTSDCDAPPQLTSSHVCAANGAVTFTVNNSLPAELAANQPYEIRDATNALVTSGTLNIPVGGSQDITVNPPASYGALTLTSTGGAQGATTVISEASDCDAPPQLSINHTCLADNTIIFTVTNSLPAEVAANQPYEIRDQANVLVTSGTLNIPVGGSQDITISPPDSYYTLTFTSTGGTLGTTTELDYTPIPCTEPPLLSIVAECLIDGTARFTITNDSTDNDANQPYEIRDAANVLVDSGTVSAVRNGGVQVIDVTNIYGELTFTSVGAQGATTEITAQTDCAEPPVLSAVSICANGVATFTITNTSGDSDANQPYEVIDGGGVVIDSGTVTATANGGTQIIEIPNIYGTLTLVSAGVEGVTTEINTPAVCNLPVLSAEGTCENGMATFTVFNAAGDSDASQPYSLIGENAVMLANGTLDVPSMGTAEVSYGTYYGSLTFNTSSAQGGTTDVSVSLICLESGEKTTGTSSSIIPPGSGTGSNTITSGGFTQFLPSIHLTPQSPDTAVVSRPAWDAIGVGEAVCPDWLVYHTDITGDWELFRLGNGDGNRLAPYDVNLSQGRGAGVHDIAPTRSPDGDWIAFTSNRDSTPVNENWELYVAKVDNSEIRRLTYNTFARDIDPVWSPDGRYLVFETDRDGQWELYLYDLGTGAETRLTDDSAHDINAFWFPDSQKLAFQSNRDGNWQIYVIDINTLEIEKVSDGTTADHDPHVSFDGTQIAFRSYASAGANSQINIMNVDGSGRVRVSDAAGNATNHTWSPDDTLIAYQSDLDGDLDIYVYEVGTALTRLVTDNDIPDYAPTWWCDAPVIVFNSDVTGDPNLFSTPALPMTAPAIIVERQASQLTFETSNDIYPLNTPSEENASREGDVPPMLGR